MFMNHRTVLLLDVCVTCELISSELWGWLGSWGSHLRLTAACWLPEEWGTAVTADSQGRVTPVPSRVGSCLERAGSKPPVGGLVSGLGDWVTG